MIAVVLGGALAAGCGGAPEPVRSTRAASASASDVDQSGETDLSRFAGTYVSGPFGVASVEAAPPYLAIVPPFWTSKPYLLPADERGAFVMALPHPRPERVARFRDGSSTEARVLEFTQFEPWADRRRFVRVAPDVSPSPGQLFFDGRPAQAAAAALAWTPAVDGDALSEFAERVIARYPRRVGGAAAFLAAVRAVHDDHAGLAALHGIALVAVGRRDQARRAFEDSLALDPANEHARVNLARLTSIAETPSGYRSLLPFHPAAAFEPPTAGEVAAVRADWKARDLGASDATIVHRYRADYGHGPVAVAIVEHRVRGAVHYGAVLSPGSGDASERRPVVVDARGVNPSYSPTDLSEAPRSIVALGAEQRHYAVLVPGMPGHALVADGRTFQSLGDPADAWDGATDATLGFLNAALAVDTGLDAERIALVGHSRGGTVALLAGARDSRIDLVLSVAGPVDHFEAMQPYLGWTWAELLVAAMADGEPPTLDDMAGQKYDHFFHRVPKSGETLARVRHRLLASSPVYFADTLPPTFAFFGEEDRSVPVANARALERRFDALFQDSPDHRVVIFERRGHDTDPLRVNQAIARALEARLR